MASNKTHMIYKFNNENRRYRSLFDLGRKMGKKFYASIFVWKPV